MEENKNIQSRTASGAATAATATTGVPTIEEAIRSFFVYVPETELIELRRRINATKWPDR